MDFRTDLALERRKILGTDDIEGLKTLEFDEQNAHITEIDVLNEAASEKIGKPVGKYITIEVPPFAQSAELLDGRLNAVIGRLRDLLPESGNVLIVGLGNTEITPDSLGPKVIQKIFSTRHISAELAKALSLEGLRPVCAISPGVLGQTGIETGEIIAGIVSKIQPAAVIVIDALAARELSRLGNTIQLCDTGISPGSGVGNMRTRIDRESLGVPVISLGVPTVIDAVTIACDIFGKEEYNDEIRSNADEKFKGMMVSPREIDILTQRASKLIALSINCALQPSLSAEEILELAI